MNGRCKEESDHDLLHQLTPQDRAGYDEWRWEMLKKLPALDPSWPPAVQDSWWAVFWKLLRR